MPDAYCTPAPSPQALLTTWNFDIIAAGLCVALGIFYLRRRDSQKPAPLLIAVAVILALFMSPLCALTTALFSARISHHVMLVVVVAPLLALAFPASPTRPQRLSLAWLTILHAGVVWLWHVPVVYEHAIVGAAPYWTMQLSLAGTAYLLWRRILAPTTSASAGVLSILATTGQMGLLGALLTFAREPLYAPHFTTTLPYGLTPLADQQLAGLIMWSPGALPYLGLALFKLYNGFSSAERAAA